MVPHSPFAYDSLEDLEQAAARLDLHLPLQEDLSPLFEPVQIGEKKLSNRLAVHPMEGADATKEGAPTESTSRRYSRFAQGGSSLIWFEATAVIPEGRANPRQLWLSADKLDSFRTLIDSTRKAARRGCGEAHEVLCVLQLTHSGRYSKPRGVPRPQAGIYNPHLDLSAAEVHVLRDDELDSLQDAYVQAAGLAQQAGFDGVDIKCCHGYLLNDLLSGYAREHSRYGGSFANRTRFLSEVYARISAELPGFLLSSRLSAYDGLPFPYGFGFSKENPLDIDLTEIRALTRRLAHLGGALFNYTAGNPYLKPHLGRPYDSALTGSRPPDEHPLVGVKRLLSLTAGLQLSFPDLPMVGTGYSWLRHFFPYAAAAVLERREATLIGLGRSALAYPEAPKELMERGRLNPKKVCVTCSKCSQLLRNGARTGCVVRDADIYAREYAGLSGKN